MKIKKILIKNYGPIRILNENLSNLNIVYGKNEQGKSFLVEALIKCLFKNTSYWGYLREVEGSSGKIIVEGLNNKDVEFQLTSKKEQKLEDYLEKDPRGLPPSLSKLLVVKGGEFEIVKNEKCIEKDFIKDILSGKRFLDSIKSKISTTIQQATIEGGIIIKKQGEGKTYSELKEKCNEINNIINRMVEEYETGEIKNIEIKIKELEKEKENLLEAKRYKAYQLFEKIKQKEKELEKIPEDELSSLSNDILSYNEKNNDYQRKLSKLNKLQEQTKYFVWLKGAKEYYFKYLSTPPKFIKFIESLPYFSLLLLSIATALIFSGQEILAGTFVLLAVISIVCYKFRIKKYFVAIKQKEEIKSICDKFKEYFNSELNNIADIDAILNEQSADYNKIDYLKDEITQIQQDIQAIKISIQDKFKKLSGKEPDEQNWNNELQELKKNRKNILNERENLKEKFNKLDVDETDFVKENPGIEFSPTKIKETECLIEEFKKKQDAQHEKLLEIKSKICAITSSDISTDWNSLIEKLYSKKEEIMKDLKELETTIIAGKILCETINELLREEDEKIVELMNSEEVTNLLFTVTKRYNKLLFDNSGNIRVSDDSGTFLLKDLSTGAKEQVSLALRIGFAKKIMKQDSIFLILDDAFQHSDYERRPILVNSLIELAKAGWQIIYLTMDDNIKELFEIKSKNLEDKYKIIEL